MTFWVNFFPINIDETYLIFFIISLLLGVQNYFSHLQIIHDYTYIPTMHFKRARKKIIGMGMPSLIIAHIICLYCIVETRGIFKGLLGYMGPIIFACTDSINIYQVVALTHIFIYKSTIIEGHYTFQTQYI